MLRLSLPSMSVLIVTFVCADANAQGNCACPPQVPPVPSCGAPAQVYSGCAEQASCYQPAGQYCGANSANCSCSNGKCSSVKCCRPFINIDFSKRITKTRDFGSAAFGGAPPQGFVAASMPVMPLNISAMPVSFNTSASAGLSDADLVRIAAAVAARSNGTAAAAAGDSDLECKDPCGDIKQLRMEVNQIKDITRNLAFAVDKLADAYKANPPAEN